MPRVVRGGLIQATLCEPATSPVEKIKKAMVDKHVDMIGQAAQKGVEVICLQELFSQESLGRANQPYPGSQPASWN